VYLDPAWADSKGFNYSVASNNSTGTFLRDFALNVVKDAGTLLVAASNQSPNVVMPVADLGLYSPVPVTTAGWYTLSHTFRDAGGTLAVDVTLTPVAGGAAVLTATLNAGDPIAGVGGSRYGWFTVIDVDGGLRADNVAKLGATTRTSGSTAIGTGPLGPQNPIGPAGPVVVGQRQHRRRVRTTQRPAQPPTT